MSSLDTDMTTTNTSAYIFGKMTRIDTTAKKIYLVSNEGAQSVAAYMEDEHFDRLLYYFQHDDEKVVTYRPLGELGIFVVDVQIYSYEWYGIQPE